ncbi:MAG: efflux RND transporter periplasmic adaptor subunit [Actinobacteria bacterium]|nr:MAG: efflux RND transporter periplasmic adaptor subunit [Actinomycetota bacterium]
MSRRLQIAIAVGVLVLIGVIIALAVPKPAKTVSVTTVGRRTMAQTIDAPGKVSATEKTEIGSTLAGRIDEVLVKEGDLVAPGDALMTLEAEDLEIAVEQARVNVQVARLNEDNAREARQIAKNNLAKLEQGVPASQLAVSQATVAQAQAGVAAAQQGLADVWRLNETSLEQAKNGVVQARKAWEAARQAVTDAKDQLDKAQASVPPLTDLQLAGYQAAYNQAVANYAAADAALDGAKFALEGARAANSQAINAAQAQLVTAQRTADVAQAQFDLATSASGFDVDSARHQLSQADIQVKVAGRQERLAELALKNAQVQQKRAVIKSPIVGVVDAVNVNEGQVVVPGAAVPGAPPIAVVVDPDKLLFEANVDEADVVRVRRGQNVKIALDAYPDRTFGAKVRRIAVTTIQTEEGGTAYPATVTFARGDIQGLREGMNGDADVTVQTVRDVLAVPAAALVQSEGTNYVFVVRDDSTLERRRVRTGRVFQGSVEVTSGLREGERVVARGTAGLQEGDRVEAR